ncbi:AsmA-like C-terminal domain-containing protein [Kiloniella laminariae]|uniref:YhdP family protein n=1 Tax=Kiloniella laminariae TaxID=454162 RepID=UPI000381C751|nr:AsmA-like C-terminal domain-containing protein [Kiloniella laminariae]
MIRKTSLFFLEALAALLVLSAVMVGILIWRLSSGPVTLDFLTPYVEEAFVDEEKGLRLDVATTQLAWLPKERAVALQVERVRILDETDRAIAAIPLMGIDLNVGALARGKVVPTGVKIIGPRLNLVRDLDGRIEIGSDRASADTSIAEPRFGDVLPDALKNLMAERTEGHPLAYLDQLQILRARIRVQDKKLGLVFTVPNADMTIRRDKLGLSGELDFLVDVAEEKATLNGAFVYDKDLQIVDLAFQVTGIRPTTLAKLDSGLADLSEVDIPLAASVSTSLNLAGEFGRSHFEISGGPGSIALASLSVPKLPVQGMFLKGSYSKESQKLVVDNAAINFGEEGVPGPQLSVAGSVSGLDSDMQILAGVRAVAVPVDDLALYWPEIMATDAREWVTENIKTGLAEEAVIKAVLEIPEGNFDNAKLVSLDGSMKYRDLDVHYLRPLPPVRQVSGTADIRADGLTLFADGGVIEDMSVLPSTITVSGLDVANESISIQTAVEGPVRTALEILNSENLRLVDELNIDPQETAGDAAVAVDFDFLLLKDLKLKDITIDVSAAVKNARIGKIYDGLDVTEGDLKLKVTGKGMEVTGPVKLAAIPVNIAWDENFGSNPKVRTKLKADFASIDPEGLSKLGIPVTDYLAGPVSLSLALENRPDGNGVVQLAANLKDAKLNLEGLAFEKPEGTAGNFKAVVILQDGKAVKINSFDLAAGELELKEGRAELNDGKVREAFVRQFQLEKTLLSDVAVILDDEKPEITIGGGVLDTTRFIGGDKEPEVAKATDTVTPDPGIEQVVPSVPVTDPLQEESVKPIRVTAQQLDAMYMGDKRFFRNVSLVVDRESDGLKHLQFTGEVPEELWHVPDSKVLDPENKVKRTARIDYLPLESGRQGLRAESNDFGAMLRALDVLDTVEGGSLTITGDAESYRSADLLSGKLDVQKLRLVKAPVLAKMLSVASLTGPVTALSTEGIAFDELVGDFTVQNGLLRSDLIKLYSSSIGLTAKGEVDTNRDIVAARGTIVPAYTINRILGGIPLLGTLLTGGEGEGIVAFNYSLDGTLENPKVSINPLSGLTPGFLRNIFGTATPTTEKEQDEGETVKPPVTPEK